MSASERSVAARIRREPPTFRRVAVHDIEPVTPWMVRVTLTGPELAGFAVDEPAASVRLLLPSLGTTELVMPTWNGNEFLRADGSRPIIRTFTPHRWDPDALELELWIVDHGRGPASEWSTTATVGAEAAISGPGRGYAIDPDASGFLVGGDESAIPAISQLLGVLPPTASVQVHIEVTHADARLALNAPPRATVDWHDLAPGGTAGDALFDAIHDADIDPDARVWVAGEAAAVQRIRKHLFDNRSIPRTQTVVRGYWKHGRGGDPAD